MSGKYLRKRIPGALQDPTMMHVDDPWALKIGDVIRDAYRYSKITGELVFINTPDTRFVYLQEVPESELTGQETIHDVRENDRETEQLYRVSLRYVVG